MAIIYSEHLKNRIKQRGFPDHYPKEIYDEPKFKFRDILENNFIAIKKMLYGGKMKEIMICYTKKGQDVKIISIHPIRNNQIQNRIKNKRWIKI
ncbi:hypothetical protein ISS86_01620 [Candidatus Microgenomates bacterium]|nr:hypothetical protein [Candidatus Microgenomates bacterium]